MIDWKMAAMKLAAAMASSASPGGCESERGRGNERERADGHVMAMLKPSLARLVGHVPVSDDGWPPLAYSDSAYAISND